MTGQGTGQVTGQVTGVVVWITGRPSAGESKLSRALVAGLRAAGEQAVVLDGDEVRSALVPAPGYDDDARTAFYAKETLGRLAGLLARGGAAVSVPATANLRRYRDDARAQAPRFLEVFVETPREVCEARDAKGLYAAVRRGEAQGLPGVDAPFEPPVAPDVVASGGADEAAVQRIVALVRGAP